jgi:hypothetical protein
MNFDRAAELYLGLRGEIAVLESQISEKKVKQAELADWFAIRAAEEGLQTVPTPHGTAYWSTRYSATVADPSAFKDFVIEHKLFDMLENRASSVAVKSYIDGNGEVPPGINFSSTKVFALRKGK